MSDEYQDPSANTAQFQAYASRPVEEPAKKSTPIGLLVGIVAAVVVVAAVVAYLLMS
jgi:hypothetical protein